MGRRIVVVLFALAIGVLAFAGNGGVIRGSVRLTETGEHLHAATVHLEELGRTVLANDEGEFLFEDVPPGSYRITAHAASTLTEQTRTVTVVDGQTAEVNFELGLATVRQQVTVTATGREVPTFEALQSVETRDSFELASEIAPSLGETLANQPGNGVAKRSFGPGSERPIIRGFDGDRVLILQDGIRTGTLSSQSGEHGELVNTGNLDRIEIVRGPATLLYGGSAVGGVVNTISRHHEIHEHAHQGIRGYLSGSGGSANGFASGSAGFEYGAGKWMIWGGGSGQSSGNYHTPEGEVLNSDTRLGNGYGGFGWYGDRTFFSAGAQLDDGIYGVPFANELHGHEHGEEAHAGEGDQGAEVRESREEEELQRVAVEAQRQNYRLSWGLRNLRGPFENFLLRVNYSRWMHNEVETFGDGREEVATQFDNKQFIYRGSFEQSKRGPLSGRFGVWGMWRDYDSTGEEARAPAVEQNAVAGYALEEFYFERVKLQFGARVEHSRYSPGGRPESGHAHEGEADPGEEHLEPPAAVARNFTGMSMAAGANIGLWKGGAFVAHYTHSYRPPALEELYNFGPHVGNLAFEVGDPNLKAERGNGWDVSVRHQNRRVRAEGTAFYYSFSNFVFPFRTGGIEDGLQVLRFTQSDARFLGSEFNTDIVLRSDLALTLGVDYVDAEQKSTRITLPRIPPLRGRVGFDWHWKGLEVKPELILAGRQDRVFTGETMTAGYGVVNLRASYTFNRGRFIHQIAVNTFNLNDRLYRNHSSFVKDLMPEIGRGIRLTYRVRFF